MMTQSHMAREVAEIPQVAARFLDLSAPAVAQAAAAMRAVDPGLIVTVARVFMPPPSSAVLLYPTRIRAGPCRWSCRHRHIRGDAPPSRPKVNRA